MAGRHEGEFVGPEYNPTIMDIGTFPFVENLLNVTAQRQQAFASNIANLDTPGYKAKDVAFQQELASALR